MKQALFLLSISVALFACGKSGAPVTTPSSDEPSQATTPFTVQMPGVAEPRVIADACLTSIGRPFVVMAPQDPSATDPCALIGEDDYAFSLEMLPCGQTVDDCPLPAPGTELPMTLAMQFDNHFSGEGTLKVIEFTAPYLVVHVTYPGHDEGSARGILKIWVDPDHPLVQKPQS